MSNRLAVVALAGLLATPAIAQTPAALSPDAAQAQLAEWGFVDIRLDDDDDNHYEFDVRDAAGRQIDIDLGFDGLVRQFDVDDDQRAAEVDLFPLLPEAARAAAEANGITDLTEFELETNNFEIEGFNAEGQLISVSAPR